MTRYRLDKETGMIWMLPGEDIPGEGFDVLGKALCMNSARFAKQVGVPEDQILHCKKGNFAVIEHNSNAAGKYLEQL